MNTGMRGDSAVLLASSKLVEAGLTLLKPISECLKFDLVCFGGNGFHKLQVKRAYPSRTIGKFTISLRSVSMTSQGAITKTYSKEDTDFILGVILESGIVYSIPIDVVEGRTLATLNPNNIANKTISNKKFIDVECYKNLITLNNQVYHL